MSTIGSLMLALGQSTPSPYGDIQAQTAQTRGRELGNETALLKLAELKRSQASEEMVMAAIQKDQDLARLFFGGSAMGGLGQAPGAPPGGPPGAGPLMQQALVPGQPPGAPQVVPGGQDLSRFANVPPQSGGPIPPDVMGQVMPTVTPPQSTLASLGAQPQGGMQGPQNPVLEMARRDPRAAMLMQGQIQAQQDQQIKNMTTQLTMREKTAEAFASKLQGVNSQESYETAVQELMQWAPQQASRLPKVWSKEAMQPIIASALSAKDKATLDLTELQRQTELFKARVQSQGDLLKAREVEYKETPQGWIAVPKYPGAPEQPGTGVGGAPVTVGGQPVSSGQEQQRLNTQQQQTRQAEMSLQGEYNKLAKPYMEVRDAFGRIAAAGTSPTAAGDAALLTAYMKMLDPTTGVRNEEIRNAENVGGLPQRAMGWLEWLKGGAPLKEDVRKDFMDRATKLYAQYQKDYEQNATQYREQAERQGLDPRNVVQDYRSTTPGGGRTAFKPVGQMSRDELLAERDRLRGGR